MAIGNRIREFRLKRKWSQGELGKKIGVHQKQISAYEREVSSPPTDVLISLADVFNISLDFLASESEGQPAKIDIQDRDLLERFQIIDRLSEDEKRLAKEILDLLILKKRFKELAEKA